MMIRLTKKMSKRWLSASLMVLWALPVGAIQLHGEIAAEDSLITPKVAPHYSLNAVNNQSNPKTTYNLGAEHGTQLYGVIGFLMRGNTNYIAKVYPGSDLINYGVGPGAYLVAIEGIPYSPDLLRQLREGTPGQPMRMTFFIHNELVLLTPRRKDARLFIQYNSDSPDNYYATQVSKERFW